MKIKICKIDLFNHEIITLIAQLDAYQRALSSTESNQAESVEQMRQVKTFVCIARIGKGVVGYATIFLPEGMYPEIKRVFVIPEYRGKGITLLLIKVVIEKANDLNLKGIYLETEVYQFDAMALYQRLGFGLTSAFSHYQPDPLSGYMVKSLNGNA